MDKKELLQFDDDALKRLSKQVSQMKPPDQAARQYLRRGAQRMQKYKDDRQNNVLQIKRGGKGPMTQQQKQQLLQKYKSIKTRPTNANYKSARDKVEQLLQKKQKQGYLRAADEKVINSILGVGKPPRQQIYRQKRGLQLIGFNPENVDDINMQKVNQVLQQAYQKAQRWKKSPDEVFHDIVNKPNGPVREMYNKLKNYTGGKLAKDKLRDAAYGKLRKQVADKFRVPLHDADIILLLDDFVEQHPQHQQDLQENRRVMQRHARQIMQQAPAFKSLSGYQVQKFGGQIKSQDPYAIDIDYVKHVFGAQIPYPAPRYNSHYMYQMATTIQVPVTTISDGTSLVVINPASIFHGANFVANNSLLPFISVASGNTKFPFAAPPAFTSTAFFPQQTNAISFALDSLQVDFIETESPLQVKGKLTTAFFYQPPNATWTVGNAIPNFTTSSISIDDTQLTNDIGYVERKSCQQCTAMTRLGTWILQEQKMQLQPMLNHGVQHSSITNSNPYILVKFTGCTPSTNIGTMYIRVSASIQPVASMRSILKVTPRGSYQGVFRAFKQARKMGLPLQFMDAQQAQFLFKENFSQIDFKKTYDSIPKFGGGSAFTPPLFTLQFDPKDDGFCVYQSLKSLGHQIEKKPWLSISDVPQLPINVLSIANQQIVSMVKKTQSSLYLTFNYDTKHAYVLRSLSTVYNFSDWGSVGDKFQWVQLGDYQIRIHETQFAQQVVQYPILLTDLPRTLKDKLIQQKIIVAPGISIHDPLIQFDMQHYANHVIWCRNGQFKVYQDKIFFTKRRTKQLVIVQNPSIADLQTLSGQLITISGRFAQHHYEFAISNAYVKGQNLILNQSALQSIIKYSLMCIQKNPGPGVNPYKQYYKLKPTCKRGPRRYLTVKRNALGNMEYYDNSKKPTMLTQSDVECEQEEELINRIQKRTLLDVAAVKAKLGL